MLRTILLALVTLLVVEGVGAQCVSIGTPGLNGCGGRTPFGIPLLQCNGAPARGNAGFSLFGSDPCAATAGFLLIGVCHPQPVLIRGLFGTGGFCGPSQAVCAAAVDPVAAAVIRGTPTAGGFMYPVPVPNDPGLAGVAFCGQSVLACSAGSCIGVSHGVTITVQ